MLALFALRRPRNLAAVLIPYAALGLFAAPLGDPAALLLALSPSPLIGPWLARIAGTREETVGALMIGTVVISLLALLATVPAVATQVNTALLLFGVGAAIAGAVPTMRDALLPVLDGARYVAAAIALGAAAVASLPLMDLRAVAIAAGALAIGTSSAAIGTKLFGGDPRAAAIGGGARDPSVAAGLALAAGLAGGPAVPLAYAALLALALGLGKLLVRRQS
ncbi:MAG TPA: hypothetical protein VGR87_00495 [Candidatus Limnocylindria bacterium]|nr:hypothetical protein [Candidatus Limnocylindria bacterium]